VAVANAKDAKGKSPADPKQEAKLKALKQKWSAATKVALRIAAVKTKSGQMRWVGFAFSPGASKADHMVMIDVRKKGTVLMKELKSSAPDRKELCCGVATVTKDGTPTLWLKYIKRLGGAERKMQEALAGMGLRYLVKMRKKKDDEAADAAEEAEQSRTEDGLEDELETTAEEFGDEGSAEDLENMVGQHDDLDELENAKAPDEDGDGADQEEEEEPEDEEEGPAKAASGAAGAAHAALGEAPKVWQGTHRALSSSIDKLKAAIKAEYAGEAPGLMAEIEKNIGKLDKILEKLDHRLADSMEKAHKAPDDAARKSELAKARNLLKEHIVYVSSEPLIAHIDANPFVKTDIKSLLTKSLKHMAKVVG